MKVRVLGCSGAIAKDCRTTSFLIDGDILIDAGTGVGDLTLDEMRGVDHVFLTHSHLDHVAALPLMVDAVAARRTKPLQIHALAGTISALKAHIFNDLVRIFGDGSSADPPSDRNMGVIGRRTNVGVEHKSVSFESIDARPVVG